MGSSGQQEQREPKAGLRSRTKKQDQRNQTAKNRDHQNASEFQEAVAPHLAAALRQVCPSQLKLVLRQGLGLGFGL